MRTLVRLIVDLLRQDTRSAVRSLWKHRGFTAFATLSLALGIGANTALFSLVDRLLLRSLAVREPDRLVEVQQTISRLGIQKALTVRRRRPSMPCARVREIFPAWSASRSSNGRWSTIDGADEPERRLNHVSDDFFSELGITAGHRPGPQATDDAVGNHQRRLVAHAIQRQSRGAGPVMTVDGRTYTIVGVAPPQFRGLALDNATDAWIVARARPAADDRAARARRHARAGPGGGAGAVPAARAGRCRGRSAGATTYAPRSCRPAGACPVARTVPAAAGRALGPRGRRAPHHLHQRRQPAHGPSRRAAP